VNYIAVDAHRMGEFLWWFHMAWTSALQIVLSIVILFGVVGIGARFQTQFGGTLYPFLLRRIFLGTVMSYLIFAFCRFFFLSFFFRGFGFAPLLYIYFPFFLYIWIKVSWGADLIGMSSSSLMSSSLLI